MRAPQPIASQVSGFTLVELLVAISVMALLSVLLFGGLRFALHSAKSVDRRIDDASRVALAYDFMHRELAAAQPIPVTAGQPQSPLQFDGRPESVTFIALPPAHLGLGGFLAFRLALENGDPQRRLTVSWTRLRRDFLNQSNANSRPSMLMKGVRSLQLAYFGRIAPSAPPDWTDIWTGRPDLPRLVRVRLILDDGYRSPDLIVALRLRPVAQP